MLFCDYYCNDFHCIREKIVKKRSTLDGELYDKASIANVNGLLQVCVYMYLQNWIFSVVCLKLFLIKCWGWCGIIIFGVKDSRQATGFERQWWRKLGCKIKSGRLNLHPSPWCLYWHRSSATEPLPSIPEHMIKSQRQTEVGASYPKPCESEEVSIPFLGTEVPVLRADWQAREIVCSDLDWRRNTSPLDSAVVLGSPRLTQHINSMHANIFKVSTFYQMASLVHPRVWR